MGHRLKSLFFSTEIQFVLKYLKLLNIRVRISFGDEYIVTEQPSLSVFNFMSSPNVYRRVSDVLCLEMIDDEYDVINAVPCLQRESSLHVSVSKAEASVCLSFLEFFHVPRCHTEGKLC